MRQYCRYKQEEEQPHLKESSLASIKMHKQIIMAQHVKWNDRDAEEIIGRTSDLWEHSVGWRGRRAKGR